MRIHVGTRYLGHVRLPVAASSTYIATMPKRAAPTPTPADETPDICEVCGQRILKNSAASIEHHSTPRHLPYTGKRQSRWRR